MENAPQLIVVVATYNERQTLPRLVDEIRSNLPFARILVVDDNSPDGTGRWVAKQAKTKPFIELFHRDDKQGLGAATIAGLNHALQSNPKWIATIDADLSHDPADFAQMWHRLIDEALLVDVLIGSRYVGGGKIENWPLTRRLASRLANLFARWILWLPARDNTSACRIYRSSALRKLDLVKIDCRGHAYLEQILVHLRRAGCTFAEHPITFHQRLAGHSKITLSELFRSLREIICLAVR